MRRSILTSLVLIGAAIAVVIGSGTFAEFTDTENISGDVEAAILDFELTGDGDTTGVNEAAADETLTISFDDLDDLCGFDFFAPGDSCTIEVELTRSNVTQQLAADLAVTSAGFNGVVDSTDPVSPLTSDCDGGAGTDWTLSWAFRDDDGAADDQFPAGVVDDDQYIDVTIALGDVGNECQDDEITDIAITIVATQATNAHDETYD